MNADRLSRSFTGAWLKACRHCALLLIIGVWGWCGSPPCEAQGVNLNVPGPDYSLAAKAYAQNQEQPKHRPMVFMPAQTEGYNVHGGVSTGVMAGSHHTSGEYTSG